MKYSPVFRNILGLHHLHELPSKQRAEIKTRVGKKTRCTKLYGLLSPFILFQKYLLNKDSHFKEKQMTFGLLLLNHIIQYILKALKAFISEN